MWDIVVIGLGGVGSYALRAASQIMKKQQNINGRSIKVLGIEKFQPGHEFGSSHGNTRIYRHAYFEHSNYVPLIQYSTKEFKSLQRDTNYRIVEECGTLIVEDETLKNSPDSFISKCFASAQRYDIKVDLLSPTELVEMYPQFQHFDAMNGLYEYKAGFVRPELAMDAALNEAKRNGAALMNNATVEGIQEVVGIKDNESFVEISVSGGGNQNIIQSRKVLIAAGAWSSRLIPSWSKYLKVTRQVQAWVDTSAISGTTQDMYNSSHMPTWLIKSNKLKIPAYGFPCDPYSSKPTQMKIALHGRDVEINPDLKNAPVTKEEVNEIDEAFKLFFKNTNELKIVDAKACMYTVTPDEHFLLGRPEEFRNVYAAAGLSGHGFKMLPGLGKILVDMAMEGGTEFDVEFLSPSRFEEDSSPTRAID